MRTMLVASLAAVLTVTNASADDPSDVEYLTEVMNQRLETQRTGAEVEWLNPSTGNGGIVVILRTDTSDPLRPCRTYRRTTERPGEPTIVVEGSACRVADALWQRSEAPVPLRPDADPAPTAPPVARADPEPATPPPQHLPPTHKPDPAAFYASIPTPSVY